MPRDSNGTMSLVSGNPVVPNTTITDSWANNTLNDIKAEITDSLSRSGKGGMLVPFENLDGNEANPGVTFEDETTSGIYRAGAGDVRMSLLGDDIAQFSTSLIKFISHVTDGASAVGIAIDTVNALSTSGAKLLRIMTNAVEKFVIDKDGYVYSDLYRVLSAVPAALKGNQADGASAVGVILDCITNLTTTGAKALSVRVAGVEKAHVNKDGGIVSGSGLFAALGAVSATLLGNVADGASAVGTVLDTVNALSTTGAKALSVRVAGVEKAYIDKDGRGAFAGYDAGDETIENVGDPTVGTDATNLRSMAKLFVATWLQTAMPSGMVPTGIAWSPSLGIFVAISASKFASSTDGVHWTERVSGLSGDGGVSHRVIWSEELTLFVAAIGSIDGFGNGEVYTSTNGITWTARSLPDEYPASSVAWSPSLGLAVATAAGTTHFYTSSNGISWTLDAGALPGAAFQVDWIIDLSMFIASGSGTNKIFTSTNGTTWTTRSTSDYFYFLAWSDKLDLLVGTVHGSSIYVTSPDGITWTQRSLPASAGGPISWSPELELFCVTSGSLCFTSDDGLTWKKRTIPISTMYALCWSPALLMFCGAGYVGGNGQGMVSVT